MLVTDVDRSKVCFYVYKSQELEISAKEKKMNGNLLS